MFQIFKNANYDFMGKRKALLAVSTFLVVASLVVIATRGVNRGIEFTGGTEMQIKYAAAPHVDRIREALNRAGLKNHSVTTIGKPEENEIYIKIGLVSADEKQGEVGPKVLAALTPPETAAETASGRFDLNQTDGPTLEARLATVQGITKDDAAKLAAGILAKRKDLAVLRSVDDVGSVEGMKPEVKEYLKSKAFFGPFALRGASYIGPTIGRELLGKTVWAILGSMAGMLIYLGIRFQFQWGVAAVIALVHDTIITLGLFSLFGKEMSLPVVAAFLTLVGYSVNDTVVVFDRIRENLERGKAEDFTKTINDSINQTLSRTIITSMLTWITVLALFFLGGEALNPFAFVLVIGIVVGTYSSIYIASPYLVLVRAYALHRGKKAAAAAAQKPSAARASGAAPVAKKVRSKG